MTANDYETIGKRTFVPTGVPGLDDVLMGGFMQNGFYLLQGEPGSGKTTLALQYLLGRVAAGEPALFVTLSASRIPDRWQPYLAAYA